MTDFAKRIRERYPEGLTGIFAIGGTRTTYILDQNRDKEDPGKIEDFAAHGEYMLESYLAFAEMFYELGGQNMIITASSFRGFFERGEEYARFLGQELLRLISPRAIESYKKLGLDPYFIGIDSLLHSSSELARHQLALRFADFQANWDYQEGHRKLIWEIASIPLLSFSQNEALNDPEKQAEINAKLDKDRNNLEAVYHHLYQHYANTIYGTKLPIPHFYLGTNKSGDLKWRSPMPLALSGGDYLRMFFTPYPTLFITPEIMQTMLDDLAFGKRFFSDKTDYKGKYTRELAQAEYERIMELRQDPDAIIGLSRHVAVELD